MSRHGPYRPAPSYPTVHRNPWSGVGAHCSDSRSTQSSGSSHTYHVLNGPCSLETHYHEPESHLPLRDVSVGGVYRGGRHPLETGACILPQESSGKYLLSRERGVPRPNLLHPPLPPQEQPNIENGRRSRPVSSRAATPVSGEATVAIVPCGGHCTALEKFCHYFLQVVFLGGIVSGLCLIVAGSVLKSDLSVLTYIGTLTALVCGVLLWVQCLVRRGPRRRPPRSPPEAIPLHNLQLPPYTLRPLPEHHQFSFARKVAGGYPYGWYLVHQQGREWYTMVEEGDGCNMNCKTSTPQSILI